MFAVRVGVSTVYVHVARHAQSYPMRGYIGLGNSASSRAQLVILLVPHVVILLASGTRRNLADCSGHGAICIRNYIRERPVFHTRPAHVRTLRRSTTKPHNNNKLLCFEPSNNLSQPIGQLQLKPFLRQWTFSNLSHHICSRREIMLEHRLPRSSHICEDRLSKVPPKKVIRNTMRIC